MTPKEKFKKNFDEAYQDGKDCRLPPEIQEQLNNLSKIWYKKNSDPDRRAALFRLGEGETLDAEEIDD